MISTSYQEDGVLESRKNRSVIYTERVLLAPADEVYDAFANADRLARWWGPAGFRNTFDIFEFKNGGRWNFVMHGPDGKNYANESVFREIVPGAKVVIAHVSQPHFTLTVTLSDHGCETKLTWAQEFETAEFADKMRPLCEPSNEQNLDRLERELMNKPD